MWNKREEEVLGNLTAPRVGLEDGCCFRGSVEMEAQPEKGRASAPPARGASAVTLAKPPEAVAQPAGDRGLPAKPVAPERL